MKVTGDENKFTKEIKKKEGFKASRYNIISEDGIGNLLLVNTFAGSFTKFGFSMNGEVRNILKRPDEYSKLGGLFTELVTRGYIINSNVDEFRKAELLHQNTLSINSGLELILMPNEDCNFRCKYCYESFAKNFMTESVQQGIIKFLERNIHRYSSLHVSWFGGEPLTAVPIIERLSKKMIEICKEKRVPYSSSMTTNGYNLTLDVFKKMLECRVRKYQITLDGIECTHDKQRVQVDGKGSFKRILENLLNIKENINSKTFHIMIRSNITKNILDNIDEFINFLKDNFEDDYRFSSFWQAAGDWGGDSVREIEETFCSSKDYIQSLKDASKLGIKFNMYRDMMKPGGSVCYASKRNSYVIGSDGIIYKCTVAFDLDENQVGVLTENGVMQLDYDKYALWVSGHESSDLSCQKCYFRPSCQGASCPLERLKNNITPCPDVKRSIKDYMKIISESEYSYEYIES